MNDIDRMSTKRSLQETHEVLEQVHANIAELDEIIASGLLPAAELAEAHRVRGRYRRAQNEAEALVKNLREMLKVAQNG